MPEGIGDILKSGGFTEAVQEAATQITTPPPAATPAEPVVTEPAVQTVVTEPVKQPETVTPPPTPSDPAVEFYKKFGFEKEEDLKSSLNELDTLRKSISEFEQKLTHYETIEREYEELISKGDEASLFGSEEEYKNFLVAQKLGKDKDFSVVQKIIRSDLNTMDDLDVLSLRDQYDIPRYAGKDDRVKKALLEDIGVDVNDPEFKLENYKSVLTEDQDLKLARLAKQARDAFNQAKGSVQIPERIDPKLRIQEKQKQREEHLTKLSESWKGQPAERVAEAASQIRFFEKNEKGEDVLDFSYDVDAEFKASVPEIINQFAIQNNLDPTPENVKGVTDLLLNAYWVTNRDKIMKAYKNDAVSKLREQLDKERYNGQPINTTEAPPPSKPDEKDEINIIAQKLYGGR